MSVLRKDQCEESVDESQIVGWVGGEEKGWEGKKKKAEESWVGHEEAVTKGSSH